MFNKKEYDRAANERNRNKCRELVTRRKLEIGKCQCGHCDHKVTIDNTHQFDFDHIDPSNKVLEISALVASGRFEATKLEIAKCRLMHVTCHRDHTREQQRLGSGFPAVQLDPDLFNPILTQDDLREDWKRRWPNDDDLPIVISGGSLRREDDFVVSRDENLHVIYCRRISTGKEYRWHALFGWYEHTGPHTLAKLIYDKSKRK